MKDDGYKNLLFAAITTILLLICFEITAYVFYAVQNSTFTFERYQEQLGIAKGEFGANTIATASTSSVPHPYFGYTPNPEVMTAKLLEGNNVSDYGFIDNQSPIHVREPNEILIGIAGGSVAAWFFMVSRNEFEASLRKYPAYKSKKITFINMSAGGWKQPQQLLSFTYLLSLGAKFDLIVNIDGFNDLVMPIFYNLPKSVFPFYPTNWYLISQLSNPGYTNAIVDQVKTIDAKRNAAATFMQNSFLSGNILSRLVWINFDRYQERRTTQLRKEFAVQQTPKSTFTTSGPNFTWPKEKKDQYVAMASYWAQSSKQMRLLANANNIKYFHFLQPNQYVPGSKILNKEELATAFAADSEFREIVQNGYDALQKEGALLKNSGEDFYDLTGIFKNNNETVYHDTCCHYNKRGFAILGDKIAEAIAASKQ